MIARWGAPVLVAAALVMVPGWAEAQASQDVPTIDTEDATLGSTSVAPGDLRLMATLDVRNGDYARGAYDDDDAGLGRLPVHAAVGFAAVLRRRADGQGSLFLIGQTSNGFHAPAADERRAPRSWYESNSILALAARPVDGLTTAIAYAVKVSPNGVAPTTHEASLSARYAGRRGLGRWRPMAVATRRTRGDGGLFTLVGITPEVEAGPVTLSFPLSAGVGWSGFYGRGSGNHVYVGVGSSVEHRLGDHAALSAQLVGLVRDPRLAALDRPRGTDARVVPVLTIALTVR